MKLNLASTSLLTSLFLLVSTTMPVRACTPPTNSSSDILSIGDNSTFLPETTGYTLNHFALITTNLTATRSWYTTVFGLRHIFTFNASPEYSIMYMGYPRGGLNGTGQQSGEEMYAEKGNREGLLEFLYLAPCADTTVNSSSSGNGVGLGGRFSHIGIIVPNITATQSRMDTLGVNIIKRVGVSASSGDAENQKLIANAYGLAGASQDVLARALAGIEAIGFQEFLLVRDLDGNVVEVQGQT